MAGDGRLWSPHTFYGVVGDGYGALGATLSGPQGIAIDPATQDLVIADTGNNRVRRWAGRSKVEGGAAGCRVSAYLKAWCVDGRLGPREREEGAGPCGMDLDGVGGWVGGGH